MTPFDGVVKTCFGDDDSDFFIHLVAFKLHSTEIVIDALVIVLNFIVNFLGCCQ